MSDANNWERSDYQALILAGIKYKFLPDDWAQVVCLESGFAANRERTVDGKKVPGTGPFAYNAHGGARGLNQMMPAQAAALGFEKGTKDFVDSNGDYRYLSIEKQIDYSGRYFEGWRRQFKLDSWASAEQLYLCNFYPAHLPFSTDPKHVLVEKGKIAYTQNQGLDSWQYGAEWPGAYEVGGRKYKGLINVQDMSIAAARGKSVKAYGIAMRAVNGLRQEQLNAKLKGAEPLATDGVVGEKTKAAIGAFQNTAGIPVTTVFDLATDAALFE